MQLVGGDRNKLIIFLHPTPKDGVRRGRSWVKKRKRAPRSLEITLIVQHGLQGTQSDCPLSRDKDTGCQKDIPVLSSECEARLACLLSTRYLLSYTDQEPQPREWYCP